MIWDIDSGVDSGVDSGMEGGISGVGSGMDSGLSAIWSVGFSKYSHFTESCVASSSAYSCFWLFWYGTFNGKEQPRGG